MRKMPSLSPKEKGLCGGGVDMIELTQGASSKDNKYTKSDVHSLRQFRVVPEDSCTVLIESLVLPRCRLKGPGVGYKYRNLKIVQSKTNI